MTTAAHKARTDKALNTLVRFPFGITSWRSAVENGHLSDPHTEQEPSVKYSRTKFNRMNHAEQREYEAKLAKTKAVYYLRLRSDPAACFKCPKLVHDWAVARNAAALAMLAE